MAPKQTVSQLTALLLEDPDAKTRREAAKALGKRGDRVAVEPLCQALLDKNWRVRNRAVKALGELRAPESFDPLCAALRDKTITVRRSACEALGELGDVRALDLLRYMLSDRKESVRQAATLALCAFGVVSVPTLCAALASQQRFAPQAATSALRLLFHRHADPVLRTILSDPQIMTQDRYLGLKALERQGARWPFPPRVKEVAEFCEHVLASTDYDQAARNGAKAILDYRSLARPGSRDYATEQDTLLRAAQNAETSGDADILLRASADSPAAPPPSLLDRFKHLFSRD